MSPGGGCGQVGIVTAAVALFMPVAPHRCGLDISGSAGGLCRATDVLHMALSPEVCRKPRAVGGLLRRGAGPRLRWTKLGFTQPLPSGWRASVSMWLPPMVYNLSRWDTSFFRWFTSRFSNYAAKVNYYLPALTEQPEIKLEPEEPEQPSVPEIAVEELPAAELRGKDGTAARDARTMGGRQGICRAGRQTRTDCAGIGHDPDFLRWYFQHADVAGLPCRGVGLRIEYAKELLSEELGMSMNELAQRSGSIHEGIFIPISERLWGETPTEYLNRIKLKN